MRDDEVLAARLADEARICSVVADFLADRAPHALEHLGRAGEVDARELLVPEDALGELSSAAAHHVDDAGRQTRLIKDLHQEVRHEKRLRRRLEHDRVAHERGGRRQVGGDGREVERAHREHKAFERPVLEAVPRRAVIERLLPEQLVGEVCVVPPEVDRLAGRVDLGLVDCLRLAEHRRRVDGVPPWAGEQRCGPQQDRRTLVERGRRPRLACLERRRDGVVEILVRPDRIFGDGQLVTMG